ncbi:ankyrin repeat-containing domain protein [Poronia punctata]|nr:ankyrin repeat-containing domain protein [Poronia punctata]
MPYEILLDILASLVKKRDWVALARTCRLLASLVVPELDRSNARDRGNFALWYACLKNKTAVFQRLISHDPTTKNWINRHFPLSHYCSKRGRSLGRGMTPLTVAVFGEKKRMVGLLLANGADPNIPDKEQVLGHPAQWYPINYAVAYGTEASAHILKLLVAHHADVDQEPIISASMSGPRERQPILSHGVESLGFQCAPIFRVLNVQEPALRHSRRAQPTSACTYDEDLMTILTTRNLQLQILLQNGADPHQRHRYCHSRPLFYLLSRLDHYEPVFYYSHECILSHEIDAQRQKVNEKVISLLCTLGSFIDISELDAPYYSAPLGRRGRHIPDATRTTPLHIACAFSDCHKPLIDWFLLNGALINATDDEGKTPLMLYCGSYVNDKGLFRNFILAGADVNIRDKDGDTALHLLCSNRHITSIAKEMAIKLMLKKGADPKIRNNRGELPSNVLRVGACAEEAIKRRLDDEARKYGKQPHKQGRVPRAHGQHAHQRSASHRCSSMRVNDRSSHGQIDVPRNLHKRIRSRSTRVKASEPRVAHRQCENQKPAHRHKTDQATGHGKTLREKKEPLKEKNIVRSPDRMVDGGDACGHGRVQGRGRARNRQRAICRKADAPTSERTNGDATVHLDNVAIGFKNHTSSARA